MKDNLNYKEIGIRIQKLRLDRGLTQDQLAEIIESTQKYVSRLECGQHKLYLGTAVAVAEALQVPLTKLIADYDDGRDENTLQLLLEDIRRLNAKQLNALREMIAIIEKM